MDFDNERQEIYSERIKAGKRSYFFDIKTTRGGDYYLAITESKRELKDGHLAYKKRKVFLYKEDLNKFLEALERATTHMKKELLPNYDFTQFDRKPSVEE